MREDNTHAHPKGKHRKVLITMINPALAMAILFAFSGCARMAVDRLMDPMALSIQRQTDLELVHDGTPALILMLTGFLDADPRNPRLLMTAIKAYASYSEAVAERGDLSRASRLSEKAREYSLALLEKYPDLRKGVSQPLPAFTSALKTCEKRDVPSLFWAGYGWSTWIVRQNFSPAALVDLPRVEELMRRVVELDESYFHGAAHVFLGALYGSQPVLTGGNPEKSRAHFERALAIADRKSLMTQVMYAETYARLAFDRELFENLLTEVLALPVDTIPELSLSNQLAKVKAQRLLAHVDEYF